MRSENGLTDRADARYRNITSMVRALLKLDYATIPEDSLASLFLDRASALVGADRACLMQLSPAGEITVRHDFGAVAPVMPSLAGIEAAGCLEDCSGSVFDALFGDGAVMWVHDRSSGWLLAFGGSGALVDTEMAETALEMFVGIVERKRVEQQLMHDAFHDSLTGLPNRMLFIEHLDQAIGRAQRATGYLFSVLFIDIDRFKLVNDGLGHESGDRMLIAVGQRLKHTVRGGDVVARLGGDEFAVLADDLTELGDALRLADRIQEQFATPFSLEDRDVVVSASIGIARNAPQCQAGSELLRDADIAMYRAKETGGGQHRLFDSGMHTTMMSRLQLEADLRRALAEREFRVVYQPIIDLRTGDLGGFEALLRWQHPERGTILPGEFIAVAEETGLVVPIGRWLLRETVAKLAELNRDRSRRVTISVNLADREFLQPGLVDDLREALTERDIPAGLLHLELTERMLMDRTRANDDILPRLKSLGVQLAIDDFGTGYSSLSRLHELPIDTLKIDYSFVKELTAAADSGEIVRTIVALAHGLGIDVIAEGVERPEQLQVLRELGCEFAQGFLLSHPVEDTRMAPALDRADWLPAL